MLSHHEERSLAEIEARLRADSPHLLQLFDVEFADALDSHAPSSSLEPAEAPLSWPEPFDPSRLDDPAQLEWNDDPFEIESFVFDEDTAHDALGAQPVSLGALDEHQPRACVALAARLVLLVLALALAIALTAVVTLIAGPNVGGLIGAASIPLAGLYGWSLFGCPARR